jgi:hypothetical protein
MAKFFHGKAVFFLLAGVLGIAALLAGLRWLYSRRRPRIHWAWLVVFWVTMTILYAVLYPTSQRHIVGPGSDEEDQMRIAGTQMLQLHYPYLIHTYLGGLITPMPGAVFLSIPFLLLGRVSFQNPVWLAIFILFCVKFFRSRSTVLAFLLIMMLTAPEVLDDFVVGNDFTVNALYICVAVFFFLRTYNEDTKGWRHILAGVFLGFALSSRTLYVVIPPLVLAYLLQQGKGTMAAWRSFALPILTAVAITAPFYLYDPSHFSPLHLRDKIEFIPIEYRYLVLFLLPALALLIACSGFFMRLTMSGLFLLAGFACAMILLSPGLIAFAIHKPINGMESIYYCKAAAIFVALWAFSRFENASWHEQAASS